MEPIEWRDEYSVKVEQLDQQHKVIFKIVNRLAVLDEYNLDPMQLSEILDTLRQYTNTHFALEEELMEKAGYDHLDEHKQSHAILTKRIAQLCFDVMKKEKTVNDDLLDLLKEWWVSHIMEEDQGYSQSLTTNGQE